MFFFFQAEDGIRDLVRSRGLGDVYKRQRLLRVPEEGPGGGADAGVPPDRHPGSDRAVTRLGLSLIHI